MTNATPQMVISGIPYAVVEADGAVPASIADIASASTIVVEGGTGRHRVTGAASEHEGGLRFYEKAGDAGGKDTRVWTISEAAGRFEATTT